MGVTWDADTERQLLLAIIHVQSVSAPDWNKIAKVLGPDYVANAIRQKFAKMKQGAAKQFGEIKDDGDDGADIPKKTPAKRGGGKKAAGSAKKRGATQKDSDDEDLESPTKKVKSEVAEDEDDDERL